MCTRDAQLVHDERAVGPELGHRVQVDGARTELGAGAGDVGPLVVADGGVVARLLRRRLLLETLDLLADGACKRGQATFLHPCKMNSEKEYSCAGGARGAPWSEGPTSPARGCSCRGPTLQFVCETMGRICMKCKRYPRRLSQSRGADSPRRLRGPRWW